MCNKCLKIIEKYRNGLARADELNLDISDYDEDRRDLIEWYVQKEGVRMLDRIIEVIEKEKVQEICVLQKEIQRLKKDKNRLIELVNYYDCHEGDNWEFEEV